MSVGWSGVCRRRRSIGFERKLFVVGVLCVVHVSLRHSLWHGWRLRFCRDEWIVEGGSLCLRRMEIPLWIRLLHCCRRIPLAGVGRTNSFVGSCSSVGDIVPRFSWYVLFGRLLPGGSWK